MSSLGAFNMSPKPVPSEDSMMIHISSAMSTITTGARQHIKMSCLVQILSMRAMTAGNQRHGLELSTSIS